MQTTTQSVAPNPNFQVITHNGKMPSDGGLRMGYRALDQNTGAWHEFWFNQPIAVAPQVIVAPPKAPLPQYSEFPTLHLGGCPKCGTYIGRYRIHLNEPVATADRGEVLLYRCECGQLIRGTN